MLGVNSLNADCYEAPQWEHVDFRGWQALQDNAQFAPACVTAKNELHLHSRVAPILWASSGSLGFSTTPLSPRSIRRAILAESHASARRKFHIRLVQHAEDHHIDLTHIDQTLHDIPASTRARRAIDAKVSLRGEMSS